jgi:hypothetical protein
MNIIDKLVARPNNFPSQEAVKDTKKQLQRINFALVKEENITSNVFDSMTLENNRKIEIIKAEVPKLFHELAGYFAAAKGTPMYEGLRTRELEYLCYALRKQSTIQDKDMYQIMPHTFEVISNK